MVAEHDSRQLELVFDRDAEYTCYQCEQVCNYLFDDSRCLHCTGMTPEEVQGEYYEDE